MPAAVGERRLLGGNSMKSAIRPFLLSAVLLSLLSAVHAQQPFGGAGLSAPISSKLPGYTWFAFTAIDEQWGYDDNYVTVGSIQPIYTDRLDGWWFVDGRAHMTDQGNWFANLGLGRRVHFAEANADLSTSVWFDYDHDIPENFGHEFYQIGVSGYVRTSACDVYINGYIPIGTTDYEGGDSGFVGNQIVVPGLDNALEGFDAILRTRPGFMQMVGGRFDLGGYYYRSDVVDGFGGIHLGLGFDLPHGVQVNLQYNNDSLYQSTGMLQFVWRFGGGGYYSPTGRGLEPTVRRDHIVRRHREEFIAMNPATGVAWNVIHVDNTAGGGGTGTAEAPFDTIADAETASAANDMIFVWEGDGTTTGYDAGIALKAGQYFLGDGVEHEIPIIGGTTILPNNIDGALPMITNAASPVVTLADGNVVRGFNIDGGGFANAIVGTGIAGANISNNIVQNTSAEAIALTTLTGSVIVADNQFNNVVTGGGAAVLVDGSTGAAQVADNTITASGGAGIQIDNSSGTIEVTDNTITTPAGSGVFLNNNVNATVSGNTITTPGFRGISANNVAGTTSFTGNTISDAPDTSIFANTVAGDLSVSGNTITNSGDRGIAITNTTATHTVSENTITTTGAEGILFTGTPDSTTLATNVINDPATDGISIDNAVGTWTLSTNQIVRPGDNGLQITNSAANFTSSNLNVNNPTNDGVFIDNSDGVFTFNSTTITTAGNEAVAITNSNNSTYTFQNATIQNATGVGARFDTLLDADITLSNFNVSNSGDEGVLITGVTGDVEISGSSITDNGQNGFFSGVSIELTGPDTSTLNSTITSSAINNNTLHGIEVDIDGPGAAAGAVVTTTITSNVSINENDGSGIDIDTDNGADHTIDISNNSTINENTIAGVNIDTNGAGAQMTQVKATVDDNIVNSPGAVGIAFGTNNNANLDARLDGNTVNGNNAIANGITFSYNIVGNTASNVVRLTDSNVNSLVGSGVTLTANTDDTRVDFLGQRNTITGCTGNGLFAQSSAASQVDFDFNDGTISGSGGDNALIVATNDSLLDTALLNNTLTGATGLFSSGAEFLATNSPGGQMPTLNVNFSGNNALNNNYAGVEFNIHPHPPFFGIDQDADLTAQITGNTIAGNGTFGLLGSVNPNATAASQMDLTLTGNNSDLPYTYDNQAGVPAASFNVLMNPGNTTAGGAAVVNIPNGPIDLN
jgi:hypothetical protein